MTPDSGVATAWSRLQSRDSRLLTRDWSVASRDPHSASLPFILLPFPSLPSLVPRSSSFPLVCLILNKSSFSNGQLARRARRSLHSHSLSLSSRVAIFSTFTLQSSRVRERFASLLSFSLSSLSFCPRDESWATKQLNNCRRAGTSAHSHTNTSDSHQTSALLVTAAAAAVAAKEKETSS